MYLRHKYIGAPRYDTGPKGIHLLVPAVGSQGQNGSNS